MKRVTLAILLVAVLLGCQTVPTDIPEDLTAAELIQLAQDSADADAWDAAIAYYTAVSDRFTEDRPVVVTVIYEIAFIEYKRDNLDEATAGFQEVTQMYRSTPDELPRWPLVLAEQLLAEIRNRSADPQTQEPS